MCLEAADCDGAAAAHAGCACRGSAGGAHLSCLVAAAQAKGDGYGLAWCTCPTCKQQYTGPINVGLARAAWSWFQNRAESSKERLLALHYLVGALAGSHTEAARAEARPLHEEVLATMRRSHGDAHPATLRSMTTFAGLLDDMGDPAAALALLVEALPGCRRAWGEEGAATLNCMNILASVRWKVGQLAQARSISEEAMMALRQAERRTGAHESIHIAAQILCNSGALLVKIGDLQTGMALHDESVTIARRVLGEVHPLTQEMAVLANNNRKWENGGCPADMLAGGSLVGLGKRPELNRRHGFVLGFDAGRYRVRLYGAAPSAALLGIKPTNLRRVPRLDTNASYWRARVPRGGRA